MTGPGAGFAARVRRIFVRLPDTLLRKESIPFRFSLLLGKGPARAINSARFERTVCCAAFASTSSFSRFVSASMTAEAAAFLRC